MTHRIRVNFFETIATGQTLLFFLVYSDGKLEVHGDKATAKRLLEIDGNGAPHFWLHGWLNRSEGVVRYSDDPEKWLRLLPRQFSGSYLRAGLVESSMPEATDGGL